MKMMFDMQEAYGGRVQGEARAGLMPGKGDREGGRLSSGSPMQCGSEESLSRLRRPPQASHLVEQSHLLSKWACLFTLFTYAAQ